MNIISRVSLDVHTKIATCLDDNSSLRMRVAMMSATINFASAHIYECIYGKPLIEKQVVDLSHLEEGFFRGIPERVSKELILKMANYYRNQLHTINLIWSNKFSTKLELQEIDDILSKQTSLRSLSLGEYKNFPELEIPKWPTGLETLVLNGFEMYEEFVQSLPQSLTTLVMKRCYPEIELIANYIQQLPQQLTSLVLSNFAAEDGKFISCLPGSLTTLILKYRPREYYTKLKDEDISKLPKGLMTLVLMCDSHLSDKCFSQLPRTLTKLSLELKHLKTKENIEDLPRGLKSCKLNAPFFPPDGLSLLPSGLTELSLIFFGNAIKFSLFPRELKNLKCERIQFSHECISQLPPELTRLQLVNSSINSWQGKIPFPSNLRSIDLFSCEGNAIASFINALPAMITTLNLSETFLPLIPRLPDNLTALNLKEIIVEDRNIEIAKLPRSLKALDLTNMKNLTSEEMSQLPPELTSLNLCGVDIEDDDTKKKIVSLLPKSLTEIGLSRWAELDKKELKKNFPEMNFVEHVHPDNDDDESDHEEEW